MKTIKTWLLTISTLLCSITASAQSFGVDGIYYRITSSKKPLTVGVTSGINDYVGEVAIPDNIIYEEKVYTVTSIEDWAFYDCSNLTSITIPNSVTSIGDLAFSGCSGLTSVTIPYSVISIGREAFYKCSGLSSLSISNGVTNIGSGAFWYCSSLTSVTIPNSVTSIEDHAFYYCSSLTNIIVEEGNTVYDSRNNCNAIIETATNTLTQGCNSTIIPNSVTSIGDAAFCGYKGLTSIPIPNSVTNIGGWAFMNCSNLTTITIPNSVTNIGDFAFNGCKGLASITIPNSITSIGDEAFVGCFSLLSIVIEEGNTVYDSRNNCNAIIETATNTLIRGCNSTVIPNSVTSIGDVAFDGCTSLASIIIPNSVTSIGKWAFMNCSGLVTITLETSTPPTLGNNNFTNEQYASIIVRVPEGALADYQSVKGWKEFQNIVEYKFVSDGIHPAAMPDNGLNADSPIYNQQGVRMTNTDNLPTGIYIRGGKKFVVK